MLVLIDLIFNGFWVECFFLNIFVKDFSLIGFFREVVVL